MVPLECKSALDKEWDKTMVELNRYSLWLNGAQRGARGGGLTSRVETTNTYICAVALLQYEYSLLVVTCILNQHTYFPSVWWYPVVPCITTVSLR